MSQIEMCSHQADQIHLPSARTFSGLNLHLTHQFATRTQEKKPVR